MTEAPGSPGAMAEDDLRERLDYAESYVRGAVVSAFDRLAVSDPAQATRRLLAVDDIFKLGEGLRHGGRLTPESRYFAAATRLGRAGLPVNHESVLGQMVGDGARPQDQAVIARHLHDGPDQVTGRHFEAFAAAAAHLHNARGLMAHGARLTPDQTADVAEFAERIAALEEGEELVAGAPGTAEVSRTARILGLLGAGGGLGAAAESAGHQLGTPAGLGAGLAAVVLVAAGAAVELRSRGGDRAITERRRTAAKDAATALGRLLDDTHMAGALARYGPPPATKHRSGPRQASGSRR